MQCPIDGTPLVMSDRQGVEIDYCPKCRGVWLDRGELDKIIERAAAAEAQAYSQGQVQRPAAPPPPQQQPPPMGEKPKNDQYYRERDDYDDDDYRRQYPTNPNPGYPPQQGQYPPQQGQYPPNQYPPGQYPPKRKKSMLEEMFDIFD